MRLPRRACRAALSALAALATALSAPAAPAQERRVELVFAPELLNRIATDNLGEHTDEITRRILGLSPGIEAVRLTRASGRVTLAVTPRAQDDLRPTFRFTVDKMLYYRMNTARGDITGMTEALQEARAAEPLLRAIAYRSDERYAVVEFTLDLRAAYQARSRERAEEQERARAAAQRAGADAGARTAAEAKPAPATAPQRAEPLPASRGDMATFRVGDKARMVNCESAVNSYYHKCNGDEVTILGLPGSVCGFPRSYEITKPAKFRVNSIGIQTFAAPPEYLAPLTDPGADAFIARLKKLGSEPVNDAPKVEVTR